MCCLFSENWLIVQNEEIEWSHWNTFIGWPARISNHIQPSSSSVELNLFIVWVNKHWSNFRTIQNSLKCWPNSPSNFWLSLAKLKLTRKKKVLRCPWDIMSVLVFRGEQKFRQVALQTCLWWCPFYHLFSVEKFWSLWARMINERKWSNWNVLLSFSYPQ